MKAVVYDGPRDVTVKEVPDPSIREPTDAIIRITTTNICGSDLGRGRGSRFGGDPDRGRRSSVRATRWPRTVR
jgi:threonine dehydrogenase-like Zn-dependent dehydrogenase